MAKCDVCGKNSLLPEKFGAVNVCKVCFMKANGLLWKHQYERYEEAEKQRCNALETVHKHNFPQPVIAAINEFFTNQMNGMLRCDCCGQPVQHLQKLGNVNICKQCFGKINTSAWKETEYEDNNGVEKNREKILKIAIKNGFPPIVVEAINGYFDSKLEKGLIRMLDSHRGQKLKIYETYCVLTTTDNFDIEESSKGYGKALKKSQPKESLISNSTAKSLARSVLTGGIVKAGINLATSAAINVAADAIAPEKAIFKVVKGKYKIDYQEYDSVDYQKAGDGENDVGYIRFRNSNFGGNPAEDIVFIFENNTDKQKAFSEIQQCMNAVKENKKEISKRSQITAQSSSTSVADEILKFKNLLDMGAITQEEFDAKKKELL